MEDTDSCFEATRRIKVCANGELDGKEMQLLQSWDLTQLIAASAQRLGIPGAQVAYNSDGIEIEDASLIETGDIIFISDGSPFMAPGRGKSGGGGPRPLRKSSTIGRSARMRKDGTTPNLGIIGGYRVGRVLGEGGFGAVRLGVHSVTGDQVAMKFLNKGGSMSAAEADRVATEIACLAELEHPNVIRLIRVLNEPDFVVIVLDYAPGGDLKACLQVGVSGRGCQRGQVRPEGVPPGAYPWGERETEGAVPAPTPAPAAPRVALCSRSPGAACPRPSPARSSCRFAPCPPLTPPSTCACPTRPHASSPAGRQGRCRGPCRQDRSQGPQAGECGSLSLLAFSKLCCCIYGFVCRCA